MNSPVSTQPLQSLPPVDPEAIERQAAQLMKLAGIVLGSVLVLAAAVIAAFFGWFAWHEASISFKPENWGQTGDFIGGMVNPAVGLGTVVLIFIGLRVQRAELSATTNQLRTANSQALVLGFEQSLFSWLANYRSLLEGVTVPQSLGVTERERGRSALEFWYRRYFTAARSIKGTGYEGLSDTDISLANAHVLTLSNSAPGTVEHVALGRAFLAARSGYIELFEKRRLELDAVLRTLFRLFQWIDRSNLTAAQRWHYAALVRAQLSWVELAYLLYNACSVEGARFAYYVNRYALLDNLVGGSDPLIRAIRENPEHIKTSSSLTSLGYVWPLTPDAFSSEIARPKLLAEV